MSLPEEYFASFTFSIFLEDITTELQLRRRYSEQLESTPVKDKSSKLSINTSDSLNNTIKKHDSFTLSKFCPRFEDYLSNGEFYNLQATKETGVAYSSKTKLKVEFYSNLARKITKAIN